MMINHNAHHDSLSSNGPTARRLDASSSLRSVTPLPAGHHEEVDVLLSSSQSRLDSSETAESRRSFASPVSSAATIQLSGLADPLLPYRNEVEEVNIITTSSDSMSSPEEVLPYRIQHGFTRDSGTEADVYDTHSNNEDSESDPDIDLGLDMASVIQMSIEEITELQLMLDRELLMAYRDMEEWRRSTNSSVTSNLSSSMDYEHCIERRPSLGARSA
uniref:Uncharacterized protein n=1 Tax=Chaetoceros debilis TaxID=122233 RepID=A0A7S3PX27_9STRA|mmetsp:Transcript_29087/g.44398  ORF Transcript_29087/g.44398 Transcript_29087/m.44398 type:complete len:217 (-) Transcript_29087:62-712(-)|eukprot:CAMPEP_0194114830 /NCGR_PEP_ID=MMETSP0150-20130528/21622_1 /TAXON_ID=122233 /ORGANISM="Chaetoceros debilis, Strain MM31A-1" /LENGTH=216 /DNA_ID=CAMNT_0038805147 /DNA_START=6 /DNA_END=656 /DNA_ORIENTATION=+